MNKDRSNLLKVAKREKTFSTLARTEAKGAKERVKHSSGANKKDNQFEYKADLMWSKKRAKIAEKAKRKANV